MKSSDEQKLAEAGAGLEDIVACNSEICCIDGTNGRLVYRGYDVLELAEKSTFEEVAYLLWYGCLPRVTEFKAFLDGFTGSMKLPVETTMILRMFPKAATPMEVIRTAVSSLGHWDPDSGNTGLDACLRKAQRLTLRIPLLVAAHQRLREGLEPIKPVPGHGIAFNFLYTLQGKEPDPLVERAFDVALILHADHELNASTFAARVTAATMADIYSSVTSAIGTLKGPLHGGANMEVMQLIDEIGSPQRAERIILEKLAGKLKIPGFGHRVYRCEDPRVSVLRDYARTVTAHTGRSIYFQITQEIERVVIEQTRVFPNVDLYTASLYTAMGLPRELFTPIFAISRIVGWTSHILEQWANNRLIRPRAEYVGPADRLYLPIEDRSR
ncbi:citrate/2-methylcitrate synthase [Desulfofustis glycolicus]|uniref:Citrate synthase n=1 Tax=Desulfofustis glycolicus DSM 9705 TaxID=1121409 RepID=A0A1M5XS62_9BACT|nr:citrate/2-methylcitrate synthase [Desulfofustis glycolicus]MCB2217841.1 citrate synthase [Desulfobulbaceae bacterium]SHI02384.1 citrate synthase [Desulfofustis glycolicus DSM 9705]